MKLIFALPLVFIVEATKADDIPTLIKRKAEAHNVDPKLVYAIAMVESSLNPNAIGGLGEVGLFQLRPEYHEVKLGNIKQNVETAVKYLAYLKERCYEKYGDAWFICFNTGPNRSYVIQEPKQFEYYIKVMEAYERVSI